jgi:hypothetical protein
MRPQLTLISLSRSQAHLCSRSCRPGRPASIERGVGVIKASAAPTSQAQR